VTLSIDDLDLDRVKLNHQTCRWWLRSTQAHTEQTNCSTWTTKLIGNSMKQHRKINDVVCLVGIM